MTMNTAAGIQKMQTRSTGSDIFVDSLNILVCFVCYGGCRSYKILKKKVLLNVVSTICPRDVACLRRTFGSFLKNTLTIAHR